MTRLFKNITNFQLIIFINIENITERLCNVNPPILPANAWQFTSQMKLCLKGDYEKSMDQLYGHDRGFKKDGNEKDSLFSIRKR